MNTISEIAVLLRNGKSVRQSAQVKGLPITRIETIADGTINPAKVGFADLRESDCADWLLQDGDILISHINSTKHLGKCAIYEGDPPALIHGMNLLALRVDPDVAAPRYVYWMLSSTDFRRKLPRITKDSVNQSSFNISSFKKLQIPLPPLDEQKRIAEILDKADALRAKRRAALAQLDTLTQSIFLDMFGDPATNPKRWPVVLLRESSARIQIGPFGSLLHQKDYVEGGIPLVNPKHIQQGAIQPDPSETVSARKFAELDTYHLQAGDMVMGRRGEMGRCAIVNEDSGPLLCGTGSLFVRPDNEHTTSLFLLFLLSSVALKARLERLSLGQTLPNLNSQIVEGLEVPLPPLTVQLEFAARVEGARRFVNAQRKASSQLSSLFASLQQRAFRGEL